MTGCNIKVWRQHRAAWCIALLLASCLTPLASLAHQSFSPLAFSPLGYEPPEPGTYTLPVIKPATDGEVLDSAGASHHLFDYMQDKVVLVSFIYTRCSDARGCPLATGVLQAVDKALQRDTALGEQVRLLTLSFDPGHDTPAVMRRYGGAEDRSDRGSRWRRLTTASPQALQPILDGYGQYVVPVLEAQGQAAGTYSHLLKVFLIDRQQRVRNIYSVDFLHPQVLLGDIKTLLMVDDHR